jgi:hypothetical protein
LALNSGPPELPGLIDRPGRVLVAAHPADHTVRDRRLKIGRKNKWVADGEATISGLHRIAVSDGGRDEVIPLDLDYRHITCGVDTDDHRVVHRTVRQPRSHPSPERAGHVKIGDDVAVRGNQDSAPSPLSAHSENRHRASASPLHGFDSCRFQLLHLLVQSRRDLLSHQISRGQRCHPQR